MKIENKIYIILSVIIVGVIIYFCSLPDTRSVSEIIQDKYKDCIKYAYADEIKDCENIIQLNPNGN